MLLNHKAFADGEDHSSVNNVLMLFSARIFVILLSFSQLLQYCFLYIPAQMKRSSEEHDLHDCCNDHSHRLEHGYIKRTLLVQTPSQDIGTKHCPADSLQWRYIIGLYQGEKKSRLFTEREYFVTKNSLLRRQWL